MAPRDSVVADVFSCLLLLVLISNVVDGIHSFFGMASTLFCCVTLFQWRAHLRVVPILLLLALCVLSAVLGVLSTQFREMVYHFGYVIMPYRSIKPDFPDTTIKPIESRHIAPIGDYSAEMGLALYTHFARRVIEQSQNHCTEGSFIFQVGAYSHGLGSELHFHATILAHAIEKKAVFAWGNAACTLYGARCRDLYQNEHGCSPDQMRSMSVVLFSSDDWPEAKVPRELLDVLPDTFTVQQALYWWRAQAIGYLMRFNSKTQKQIDVLRSTKFNMPLGGAININIRGGDKLAESRLIAPELYVDSALELIDQSPLSYSRVLFITSDDPRAIVRARSHAVTKHLTVVSLDIPRMRYGNDAGQTASFWTYNLTISMLLQLSMTAECAAWVGSRTSNWNRLIDMFRCTATSNCRGAFVEMEETIKGYYYNRPFGSI